MPRKEEKIGSDSVLTSAASGWRKWLRRLGFGAGALLALALLLLAATPLGRYLARAGWEEARILAARRPIPEVIADPATDPALRDKLALVLEARAFARDSLGFPTGASFTQFTRLDRDTLVLLLSGARRDALVPKLWRYPLVGPLPYKGFFRPEDALAARAALASDDHDTYLRPASAFSTLGWFNDPLLSTTVRADSVDLVNTVLHELTHNRYFAAGDASFNESFANFVGARGAEWFFRVRGDTVNAERAVARWADDRLLGEFWQRLYVTLDSAFRAHPGEGARPRRLALRDSIYADARARLVRDVAPRFRAIPAAYADRVPLDNASLLARRVYLSGIADFEAALAAASGHLGRAVTALLSARD